MRMRPNPIVGHRFPPAAFAIALGALACYGTDLSEPPADSPTNGRIVWASAHDHGSLSQIYSAEADGSAREQLTAELGIYHVFTSMGSKRIAYSLTQVVDTGLYTSYHTMKPDGSGRTGPFTFDFRPDDISLDGSLIVGHPDNGINRIGIGNLLTGEATYIDTGHLIPSEAFLSPTGDRVAFTAHTAVTASHIYVIGADGTGLSRLTHDLATERHPSWSPDGEQIVYERSGSVSRRLSVIDGDGSNQRDLYLGRCERPIPWSPDATQVMCTGTNGHTEALIDVESAEVLPTEFTFTCLGWSPDGAWLACVDSQSVYTVDPSGEDRVTVGPSGGYMSLTWLQGED